MNLVNKMFNNETIITMLNNKNGNIAKQAKDILEKELGTSFITKSNKLNYEYPNENLLK